MTKTYICDILFPKELDYINIKFVIRKLQIKNKIQYK